MRQGRIQMAFQSVPSQDMRQGRIQMAFQYYTHGLPNCFPDRDRPTGAGHTQDTGRRSQAGAAAWGPSEVIEWILIYTPLLEPSSETLLGKKFRIVVETPGNRPRIVRNRRLPVCGYRAGYFGLGLAQR